MKNQFEQHFKNLLKEHEQPFDAQAWQQMSAKLDANMPVQGSEGSQGLETPKGTEGIQGTQLTQGIKGLSSLSKLILIGTTTTAVVVGTYFVVEPMFNDGDKKETTPVVNTIGPDNIVTPGPDNIITPGPDNIVNVGPDNIVTPGPDNIGPDNIGPDNIGPDNIGPDNIGPDNIITTGPDNIVNVGPDNNNEKIIVNQISDMCLGDEQMITNNNSVELIIKDENNNSTWKISPKSKENFIPEISGLHQIGFMNKNKKFMEVVEFEVSETISNAFEYEELQYIKGLPTVRAYAHDGIQSPVWKISGFSNSQKGKSIEANLYKRGTYTINLKGTDLFGCKISETQEIEIPKYNLLAVTAFIPQSSDSRKNTFIPFALTQREVSFRMIILDPKDGGLVYQTTDSSMPWDGIDIRNGQVAEGADFNWRVELINPSLNEPKVYQGLITLVKQ